MRDWRTEPEAHRDLSGMQIRRVRAAPFNSPDLKIGCLVTAPFATIVHAPIEWTP
jgi:hypothetical protein